MRPPRLLNRLVVVGGMQSSTSIDIAASPKKVWKIITDFENCAENISGIMSAEVLEPATGPSVVGLKWKETRMFAGREATETMWITEAKANSHYVARAESHGAVYNSTMQIEPTDSGCRLTMTFEGIPQTTGAKIMWALTGWMAKKSVQKACAKDLEDIKAVAEK